MPTLGEVLKDQRTKLGLSLEQAEEATRVRGRLLDMLENDDYDHLPNPGYVKGYVASYAKFLELDPVEMVDMYRRQVGNLHVHEINVAAEPVVAPTREEHALPWKTALIAVGIIVVVAVAAWAVMLLVRPAEKPVPVPPAPSASAPTKPKKSKSKSASAAASSTAATGGATASTGASASGGSSASGSTGGAGTSADQGATTSWAGPFALAVTVKDGERSWMRVTVDGSVVYEGVLAGPATKDFKVTQSAKVRVGAPSAVEVTRDGTSVKIPDGSMPTLTLRADQPQQ